MCHPRKFACLGFNLEIDQKYVNQDVLVLYVRACVNM